MIDRVTYRASMELKQLETLLQGKKIDAVIAMGEDHGSPEQIARRISKMQVRDGERYLFDIPRYNLTFFGKELGQICLEAIDKSKFINGSIVVVGSDGVKESVEQWKESLTNDFQFVHQGSNRYENVLLGIRQLKHKGMVYVTAADLPQVTSMDGVIAELANYNAETLEEMFKPVNICPIRVEDLLDFWRVPSFFMDDVFLSNSSEGIITNQGYKEPQFLLLNTAQIDLSRIEKWNPTTKITWGRFGTLGRLIFLSCWWAGPIWTYKGIRELQKSLVATREFKNRGPPYMYPTKEAGKFSILLDYVAHFFGLQREQINIRLGRSKELYMDVDSVEDAYRHALMMWKEKRPDEVLTTERLIEAVQYKGTPLLYLNNVRRDIPNVYNFFQNLHEKSKAMAEFSRKYGVLAR